MENRNTLAFLGYPSVVDKRPCSPSTLTRFRKKIGQEGYELILQESFRIHGKKAFEKDCIADTTVQEKKYYFSNCFKIDYYFGG
jgi:DNA-binding MurR/RpiR family transcriptional regulator